MTVPDRLNAIDNTLAQGGVAEIRSRTSLDQAGRQGAYVTEMQRRRLVLGMGEVAAEVGFHEASIARVCKRAGMSRRTFYELFEDREACLLDTFEAAVERMAQGVRGAYRGDGVWRERMRCALTVLLEQFDAEPHIARMCVVESLKGGPELVERRGIVIAKLVAAVEEGRKESKGSNEPPPLTAQGVVGGVLSVVHARLSEEVHAGGGRPLVELTGALMAMIVHPYLGSAAARREIERPNAKSPSPTNGLAKDPFKDLPIRFTYRTARVLSTIASDPGASNRTIARASGIADDGQTSRLLNRLQRAGLIENHGEGHTKGEANAWSLTERGEAVHTALGGSPA